MLDLNTVIILIVTVSLTTIAIGIGWQIILILIEIRKMLEKTNSIFDEAHQITVNLTKSFSNIHSLASFISSFLKVFHINRKSKEENVQT
jgi:hypothetical protein